MPIEEPANTLGLWAAVKAHGHAWPEADEDKLRELAAGWQRAGDEFTRAAEVKDEQLEAGWPDLAGVLYRTRVQASRTVAQGGAVVAAAQAEYASAYADTVTAAKNGIRTLIEDNVPLYQDRLDYERLSGATRVADTFVLELYYLVDELLDRAVTTLGAGGGIPGPTEPPPPDPGAGPFDSVEPTPEVLAFQDTLAKALAAAAALEQAGAPDALPNTRANLEHFLEGDAGEVDRHVTSEDVLEDVPGLQVEVRQQVDGAVQNAIDQAATSGDYGRAVPFTTQWREFNISPEQNRDWHYAIGNVQHQVTGTVTVHAPEQPGGQPRVEVDYNVHLYDRYNWDQIPGKQAVIAGIPLRDTDFAELHKAGLAHEYDIIGDPGETHHETREGPR
ncbi:MAG: hypothetical protein ABW000_25705 [Actinoplanes sp.]